MKFGSGVAPAYGGWQLSLHEEKLLHVLAGQRCPLDLSYLLLLYSDIFHDRVQLFNVAVSYLLKLRDVHLYLSLLHKCVAMNQHL